MSLPVREPSRSRPFSMNASARTPSHFISTAHSCRPRSGGLPMVASIGAIRAGSGSRSRWIIQFLSSLPPVANSA